MSPNQKMTPVNLRCEYLDNPLAVDSSRPRLGWKLSAGYRGAKQTAYRIRVASSLDNLSAGNADLWDSGKIRSDAAVNIPYDGKTLLSRQECFWSVECWSDRKCSVVSQSAYWRMGLLNPEDIKASWIGFDEPLNALKAVKGVGKAMLTLPPARYLRKSFVIRKPVEKAMAYVSALGICDVQVNGTRAGCDYFTPGWTDYSKLVYYRACDITGMLQEEQNALGIILADGWYAGYVGYGGHRELYGRNIRAFMQVYIEYVDGSTDLITTDRSWKAATGPIREADFLMGETYDACAGMPGWDCSGFDDSTWKRVNMTRTCNAVLRAAPHQPVRVFKEHTPVAVTCPASGRYVADFGTNFAGVVRIRVRERRGTRLVIRYAERLNPDGTVYTTNLRSARATDTYICRGGRGPESWQPRFTFHGFQYAEITGLDTPLQPDDITGIELTSALPPAGAFHCSDKTANTLYRNICQTQRANFIDIPTDCPQRDERLGWTGDAQVYMRTASYVSDIAAFFTKYIRDLNDAQRDDGQYPCVAPCKVAGNDGGPGWADAGIICPWTLYRVYGDTRILEQHYRNMKKFIAFCKKRTRKLLPHGQYHCFGDWLNIDDPTPKDLIATAFFAWSTCLLSDIAAVLGRNRDAEQYATLFECIKTAFNTAYVSEYGQIKSDSQTAYVLALAFGLLDEPRRTIAVDHLIHAIKDRDWHLSAGFIGTAYLMNVLTDAGHADVAYRLFHNDTFPSWGFAIKHGATSIWERWNGWTPEQGFGNPDMNSFAHYAFGAVGEWMMKTVAGIDADAPGYETVVIKPIPGGKITSVQSSYDSIHGRITVAWKKKGSRFEMHLTVPANTTATVYVPASSARSVKEGSLKAENAPGVTFLMYSNNTAVYRIGSGTYEFSSNLNTNIKTF